MDMKKTEQENEELKEKLKALEESSVSENGLKFGYSFNLHCPLRSSPKNSWTPLIRIRLFRIPRHFELKTISLGFALLSFTIGYVELSLFRTIFVFPVSYK